MAGKKFRFKDLEVDGERHRPTVDDELKQLLKGPKETRSREEVEQARARRNQVALTFPEQEIRKSLDDIHTDVRYIKMNMTDADDHQDIMKSLAEVKSLIKGIGSVQSNDEIVINHQVEHHLHGDEFNAFPDVRDDNIEYYLINAVVVMHNIEEDTYTIGDICYSNKSLCDIVDMLHNDPSVDVSISEENIGYINNFFDAYTIAISNMVKLFGGLLHAYDGSFDYLTDVEEAIESVFEEYFNEDEDAKAEGDEDEEVDEDETVVDDVDESDIDTDESDDASEEDVEKIEMIESPDRSLIDDGNSIQDIEDLPTMEEVEGDAPMNLRDYANNINQKISDEAADEIIKNARSARRDRSIQHKYVPPIN